MSSSVLVHCPKCHAEGDLADPALFGQPISCPVCQQVFVAPTPADMAAPPVAVPPPAIVAPPPEPPTGPVIELVAQATGPSAAVAEVPVSSPVAIETAPVGSVEVTPADAVVPAVLPVQPVVEVAPIIQSPPSASPVAVVEPTLPAAVGPVVVVAPTVAATAPVAAPVWPGVAVPPPVDPAEVSGDFLVPERPAMDGPVPTFMAPAAAPGAAEFQFAESMTGTRPRGDVKPPKAPPKNVQQIIIGSVATIVVISAVIFLMGDPLRGRKPKPKPVENPAANQEPVANEPIENIFDRIKASSKDNK